MSELRLGLDARLEAPLALAPLIDPNVHSCGTVYPHGAAELAHDEEGLFVVGMKSYGRAPTFLAMTGYEQVRSVAAALAGDHAAARRVELTLPETGVCGGAGLFDADDSGAAVLAGSADSGRRGMLRPGAGAPADRVAGAGCAGAGSVLQRVDARLPRVEVEPRAAGVGGEQHLSPVEGGQVVGNGRDGIRRAVGEHEQPLTSERAGDDPQLLVVGQQQLEAAVDDDGVGVPECDELLVVA